MVKRISKRTREQAALICAIAASGGVWRDDRHSKALSHVADALGARWSALTLALAAWARVAGRVGHLDLAVQSGEAESLLRTGWSP